MKSVILRFIKHGIVIGLVATVVGMALLTLVFCLPTERMRENVFKSVDDMLIEESQMPASGIGNYIWTNRETFTDAIMVQNAIEDIEGMNAYEHAIWVYHMDLGNETIWTPEESLKTISSGGDTSDMYLRTYARYWHGYLIYLKPLLMIFSWEQIVTLGVVLQVALLVFALAGYIYKKHWEVSAAVVAGMLFMKPMLVHVSLTMSVCWIITLAALIYMCFRHDKLEEKNHYPEFFLIIGILTAYFDFLTYPILTLGFPLCAYFLMRKGARVKETLLRLIGYCISWGLGYVGMWAMKWVVADVTLQTGTIRDAVWSVIGRTEAIGGRLYGSLYVIGLNLQEYDWGGYSVMAVVLAAVALVLTVVACVKVGVKKTLPRILPFLVIGFIPFAWIVVVQYHSALHARFTFRIIAVAAMALGAVVAVALRELISKKEK